jgi:hypothetical protein
MKWDDKFYDEIETTIEKGAIAGYEDNIFMVFKHSDFESRMIESLIVVNVAKLLLNWALPNYYQVHLEYPLKDFYHGAFPALTWREKASIFESDNMLRRKNHNPPGNKSGRIDIALTREPHNEGVFISPSWKSKVGIEIKSINQPTNKIVNDIERLSYGLALSDDVGDNSIKAGYSLFYRRLEKPNEVITEAEIVDKKSSELQFWIDKTTDLKSHYPTLVYTVKEIVIKEAAFEKIKDNYDSEYFDYHEVADNSGLVVCYLLKIVR